MNREKNNRIRERCNVVLFQTRNGYRIDYIIIILKKKELFGIDFC